ncbi:hypothetical protein [Methylobacterium sp. PvR107]|uniref:hypothetical protein n=1 Tax=Methylobacterium sp. PvR107 TaxID=2806597 RepID=UPI001AE5DD3F|nr:hypothetical protein [Methylobacterium sp. PvR107]MBP1182999.1 hypothetical protein [Methylobacterium sp. PvR107]
MPRRAAAVTQADIARAIRAMRDAGFPKVRVVMREGSITIEPGEPVEAPAGRRLADREHVVVL